MKILKSILKTVFRGFIIIYVTFSLLVTSGLDISTYKYLLEPSCEEVYDFSDGLALVKLDGRYGYINKEGDFVVEANYEEAESFSEGLAKVKIGDAYGYINVKNKLVIEAVYDKAQAFKDGIAIVSINGLYGSIDKKGRLVQEVKYDALKREHGIYTYKSDRGYSHGSDITYNYLGGFSENGLAVFKDVNYGAINQKDEVLIPAIYTSISDFSGDYAVVEKNGFYGVTNEKHEIIVDIIYDDIKIYDDYFAFKEGYNWGFMDKSGILVEAVYDQVYPFVDGLAHVNLNKKHGLINPEGVFEIPMVYNYIDNFADNGLALVKMNIFYGYINKKNDYKIEGKFDDARSFSDNGRAFVKVDHQWGMIKRHYRYPYYLMVIAPVILLYLLIKLIKFII